MKYLHHKPLICLCLSIVLLASMGSAAYARPKPIIDGTDVKQGELPFMVALIDPESGEQFCGGSLIDKGWVLTAAHCFFAEGDNPAQEVFEENVVAVAGVIDFADPAGKALKVKHIYQPGYDGNLHDIALLELVEDAPVDHEQIDTISFNTVEDFPALNASALTAGWGATQADGTGSPKVLQKITIPVIPCASDVQPEFVCAGSTSGKDSCQGDSGGPLVVEPLAEAGLTPTPAPTPSASQFVQVGVVSFGGDKCGKSGGAYTRTSAYASWIDKTITEHSK